MGVAVGVLSEHSRASPTHTRIKLEEVGHACVQLFAQIQPDSEAQWGMRPPFASTSYCSRLGRSVLEKLFAGSVRARMHAELYRLRE